jgi:nucleotide-binding universal stress UspA family protein
MKEEPMIERILIATDGSESAHEALEFGLDLAAEQNARAFVVHVAPAVDVMPYANFGYVGPSVPHEFNEHDRESLQEAAELAAENGRRRRDGLAQGQAGRRDRDVCRHD